MKVYIVLQGESGEGGWIIGAFSDKGKAFDYVKEKIGEKDYYEAINDTSRLERIQEHDTDGKKTLFASSVDWEEIFIEGWEVQ